MHLTVIRKLIKISRPRFYSYLFGTFLLGAAAGADQPGDFLEPWFWALLLFFVVPANLFLYGINDLFDADTDQFNTKKGSKEHLLHQKEESLLKFALISISILTALMALQMTLLSVALIALFMILASSYSAPPVRFKSRPFLDSYSNVLYIIPGLLGYALFTFSLPPVSVIILGWAWAAAMHAYSAIPDIAADERAGVRTIATALGAEKTLWFVIGHWSIFALLVSWLLPMPWGLIGWIYPALGLYTLKNVRRIDNLYWLFPAITTTVGFLGFWYFVLTNFYG